MTDKKKKPEVLKLLNVRVPQVEIDELAAIAQREDLSLAQYVRRLVRDAIVRNSMRARA